jgi:hypothetical protein
LPACARARYDSNMLAVVGNVLNVIVAVTLFAATIRAKR